MPLDDSLTHAIERAVRYRRQLAVDAGHPAGNLDELITGVAFAPEAVRPGRRSGWFHIGRVFDSVIAEMLEVYWQPDTDQVQIDRPKDWTPISPPEMSHEPLVWVHAMGFWATDPTYRYFFEGMEFDAPEAEALINAAKSPDGWSWRPVENDDSINQTPAAASSDGVSDEEKKTGIARAPPMKRCLLIVVLD